MRKNYVYGLIIFLYLIASYVLIVGILSPDTTYYLTKEDGITEYLSVILCLLTGCIFMHLFIKSKSFYGKYLFKTKRNYFFLLLSIFSLIIVGEEINWGQRILDIKTPEWMLGNETESQLNLHNREALFTIFGIRISAGRIYFLFCIFYFMLIPFLHKFSTKTQNIISSINLPIVPIFVAICFILNFVFWQLVFRYFNFPVRFDGISQYSFHQAAMEIYEFNFSLLLLWYSFTFYIIKKEET